MRQINWKNRTGVQRLSDRRKIFRRDNARRFTARSTTLLQFPGIGLDANGTCLRVVLR
jgi:hypothetical protein